MRRLIQLNGRVSGWWHQGEARGPGVLMRLMDHRALNDPASVRWYAGQALEQAWRRRTVEMATRLAQVAGHADPDELDRLTRAEQAAVDAVRARHRALTQRRGLVVAA